jgi:hypothetical protein
MNKRLKALEPESARGAAQAQLVALERAKLEKGAHGAYGLLRRSGHLLCRQCEGCWTHLPADLYRYLYQRRLCQSQDRKTPVTATDLLNDRVLPFFEEHDAKLLRVLTDPVLRQPGTARV